MKLLVINGPNINMLGIREPDIYGTESYAELIRLINAHAAYFDGIDGIVINPAAYTHTSVAIADALKAVKIPAVEVHISAVETREAFRQISYVRDIAVKTITGRGLAGYIEAIDFLVANYGKNEG